MASRTWLAAMLKGRCPRCREGKIFTYPVMKLAKFNIMNDTCPCCGVRLEPEPGFYQGAMYVGYGITIACIVVISAILYLYDTNSEWTYISTVIGFMCLIAPLNYRYSRILYLHFFGGIKYNPDFALERK
jgi:uncharacterized protein (DUF983 family)